MIWENITNRFFLLFNIPLDICLEDVGEEIYENNSIKILELRRFIRKDSQSVVSQDLIASLGNCIPDEVKLWFSNVRIRSLVYKLRQCSKCYKFNHTSDKCQVEQRCVTCGV